MPSSIVIGTCHSMRMPSRISLMRCLLAGRQGGGSNLPRLDRLSCRPGRRAGGIMKQRFVALMIVVVMGVAPGVAAAQDLPRVKPDAVGLSSERLERITKWLGSEIEQNKIPGAVLLIARHGKIAYFEALGKRDPASGARMTRDTIFRIYSMSKPVTTVAALMLVEEGRISLGDPIAKYMPAFAKMNVGVEKGDALELSPAKAPITVQDLMRHSSGFTYGFFGSSLVKKAYLEADLGNADLSNTDLIERIARLPLAYQPGTTWEYSHSTDVLGRLVEVVSGQTLHQFEKARLLDRLGMPDTSFYVTDPARQARVAEPFKDDRTPKITGQDVVVVKRPLPDFSAMTAGKISAGALVGPLGGAVAGAAMISAGNELVKEHAIDQVRHPVGRSRYRRRLR